MSYHIVIETILEVWDVVLEVLEQLRDGHKGRSSSDVGVLKIRRWPANSTLVIASPENLDNWIHETTDKDPPQKVRSWESSISEDSLVVGEHAVEFVLATCNDIESKSSLDPTTHSLLRSRS